MPSISVVVPVYNSEPIAEKLIERLVPVLEGLGAPYEIILVNDGSKDKSWDVIRAIAAKRPFVTAVNMMRNYGQHNALLCGIRKVKHEIVVTLDDDLQHPPECIPDLLAALGDAHDVVYGTPKKEQHGFARDLASRVTKLALQSAMGAETASKVSALRCFRAQVRDAFVQYDGPYVSIDVLLTWGTTRFTTLPVAHEERAAGVSNYTFRKLVTHALNMMTGFSTLPLQLASMIGFAFTGFGVVVLVYVLVQYVIHGGSVPGFPFLASIVAMFSGAQLLALGIIGEYLARMHFRMMSRPSYVVREAAQREVLP
jgi:undecaprenyl-phosphate 4-deoxy-4-formamido-L-arabinose transferase